MTARELLHHCFSWEIAPGIAAPEEEQPSEPATHVGPGQGPPPAAAEAGAVTEKVSAA